MLLALEKKLLGEVAKTEKPDYGNLPIGTLTDIQLYAQPRYGEVDGMPVRLEGEANRIGFSPVTKCVELGEHKDRETAWIPVARVKNIGLEPFTFTGTRGKK
jgi:hypothetical protein